MHFYDIFAHKLYEQSSLFFLRNINFSKLKRKKKQHCDNLTCKTSNKKKNIRWHKVTSSNHPFSLELLRSRPHIVTLFFCIHTFWSPRPVHCWQWSSICHVFHMNCSLGGGFSSRLVDNTHFGVDHHIFALCFFARF